jgi:hypothetical protein
VSSKDFLPQEISALILRELVEWAHALGERPQKAVITVPAYFSDAQRNATREAARCRTGSGAHSQRAHGGQPGLRLRRRIAAHGAHYDPAAAPSMSRW